MELLDKLQEDQRKRAEDLLEKAIFFNTLDSTRIQFGGDAEYVEKLKRSRVTGINLTVTDSDNPMMALECISKWWNVFRNFPQDIIVGKTLDDLYRAKKESKVAVFFGFQTPDPLADQLFMVDIYRELGIRFFQLTYQSKTSIGDGCGERTNCGLSKLGIRLVEKLNEFGIVIDLSHVGIRTTLDAIQFSEQPVIITHTAARTLRDTVRNKTDEEIKACAKKGGVIGLSPKSGFLKDDGLATGTTLDDYIDHIDYIRDLVGIDHVCVGTDVGDERKYTRERLARFNEQYPEIATIDSTARVDLMHTQGLDSPGKLYNIVAGLIQRKYNDEEILKVLGGNVVRVLKQVWWH